jgi:hypothetical protein
MPSYLSINPMKGGWVRRSIPIKEYDIPPCHATTFCCGIWEIPGASVSMEAYGGTNGYKLRPH